MQAIAEKVLARVKELLASGEVQRVLGWEKGEFDYERTPALFEKDDIDNLVYDKFCAANLSKKLVEASKLEGKTLALIKPCDSLSLNQLLCEHRVKRENIYVLGVGCKGMEGKDGLCMKCEFCKGKNFAISDEVIDDESCREVPVSDRFAAVRELEERPPRSATPSGAASFPSASAATPAATSARPARASSACLTTRIPASPPRPTSIPSRRTSSTSFAPSTWPAAARTAASVRACARRASRCTF